MQKFDALLRYLSTVDRDLLAYLGSSPSSSELPAGHLNDAVWSYVRRPAKRLRPGVLMLACGAVGGDPSIALPAAAAVELFHTWTLVHDDIIDNDHMRRGSPTVHAAAARYGADSLGLSPEEATTYGRNIAILAGDVQTGWSTSLLAECGLSGAVDPLVVLTLIRHLQSKIVADLIMGEAQDVEFSLVGDPALSDIDEEKILRMLWLKTGVLYEFAGRAGAMIGRNTTDLNDPQVEAIASFAGKCGIAFQLQDDIIGILGEEADTGKPKGSDIREGKLTLIVHEAFKNASEGQCATLMATLGNGGATSQELEEVTALLCELGGVERAASLARSYIESAVPFLHSLPESEPRTLLEGWSEFMIDRQF